MGGAIAAAYNPPASAFHAIFIHANVRFRLGWLDHLVATPRFHHWHHTADERAIDRNRPEKVTRAGPSSRIIRAMKVLMYSLDRQLFEKGGDARARLAEYGRLVDALEVVVLAKSGRAGERIADNVRLHPTNSVSRLLYLRDAARLGKRLIDEQGCDAVVTQEPYLTGWVGWKLAKRRAVKLLVSCYGNNVFDPRWLAESWKHHALKWIGKRVFERADAIQTDGFETVEDLRRRYGEKVFWKPIIPSNIGEFRCDASKFSRPAKLLFVGRLAEQKNLPMLLDVAERTKAPMTVVGDGPRRAYLEREIGARKLGGLVTHVPRLDRREIIETYATHHVLVLTSHYEGFAKVFMEAAAAGLPIVTTRVSGVANIVRDGETGVVVEQGDAEGMARRLRALMDDPGTLERWSRAIQAEFHEKYSFGAMLEIQRKIFRFLETGRAT